MVTTKSSLRRIHHDHEDLIWALSISYHFVRSRSQKNSLNPFRSFSVLADVYSLLITVLDTISESYPRGEHLIDDKWNLKAATRIWCCSAYFGVPLAPWQAKFEKVIPFF